MPLFYIVLPKWFKNRYPDAHKNLQDNSDKITSPFDVHETLKVFMNMSVLNELKVKEAGQAKNNLSQKEDKYPLTLFHKIPKTRTCADAGVSLHWCVCKGARDERVADGSSPNVKSAIELAINYMNNELGPVNKQCAVLELHQIVSAYHLDYASFQNPSRPKGLRIYYRTKPGLGLFSATVVQSNTTGSWTLVDEVIRINHYGTQSGCVVQEFKFYCYCKAEFLG